MVISNETFLTKIFGIFCKQVQHGHGSHLFQKFLAAHANLRFLDRIEEVNMYGDYFKEKVIPHKVAVYRAGVELMDRYAFGVLIPPPVFRERLLLHDLSKFTVVEAQGYAGYNFEDKAGNTDIQQQQWAVAWWHHKMNNDHHPEHWFSVSGNGTKTFPMEMDKFAVIEMIADWIGAGKTHGTSFREWLPANLHRFAFHPATARLVINLLGRIGIICHLESQSDKYFRPEASDIYKFTDFVHV